MNRAHAYSETMRLRGEGKKNKEIANILGLSYSALRTVISDPDGSKQRARRERYRGTCDDCGARTDPSSGYNAPRFCCHCAPAHSDTVWSREQIIEAIQRWAREHDGVPPVATDWFSPDRGNYPSTNGVAYNPSTAFRSWADAIEAAGFPRPFVGHNLNGRKNKKAA